MTRFATCLLSVFCMLFSLLTVGSIHAQNVRVKAGFVTDSTRVGDDINFFLTASYPRSAQVVFPDSSYIYSPFELKRKDYFPTRTRDSVSYDSAVYVLRTFEVERTQSLRLPVFVINALDCTRVYSNRDTIGLSAMVASLPDSLTADLPLKPTTAYRDVPREVNTAMIAVIVSFLLIFTSVGWVMFGPALSRRLRVRRLKKMHESFSTSYNGHVERIRAGFSAPAAEAAMVEWKKYMEDISRRPYTKLTTLETVRMDKNDELGRNLHSLDSAVYGYNTQVVDSLISLKEFADQRYDQVVKEVMNG